MKKIKPHYLVRKKPRIQTRASWPANIFFSIFFLVLGFGITFYFLDGGKYANIYAQLIDLQNINYEKNKDNLKFKLEVEKNQIENLLSILNILFVYSFYLEK